MAKRPRIALVATPVIVNGQTLTTPPVKTRSHAAILAEATSVLGAAKVAHLLSKAQVNSLSKEDKFARLDALLFKPSFALNGDI